MNADFSERDQRELQRLAGPQYAGFWIRTAAAIVDSILILLVTFPLLLAVYGWDHVVGSEALIGGPMEFLISWVLPAVASVLFWLYRQATPGKMLFGLRVVDAKTGDTLGTGQAIGRYLAYFPAMMPLFLGLIWVAFDSKKQGWHDKLAGSVVIRK